MPSDNRFFDDFTRMAEGALSALSGAKSEFESLFHQHFEHVMTSMRLVTREEFETMEAMVAKARDSEEALTARVDALERELALLKGEEPEETDGTAEGSDSSPTDREDPSEG